MYFPNPTDEEIEAEKAAKAKEYAEIYKPGEYPAQVVHSYDAIAKTSGKPMFVATLIIHFSEGKTKEKIMYFPQSFPKKISDLCKAIGQPDLYKTGNIEPHMVNGQWLTVKMGNVLNTKDQKFYLDVVELLPQQENSNVGINIEPPFNDDIPFG
jgi:hypothetical protein